MEIKKYLYVCAKCGQGHWINVCVFFVLHLVSFFRSAPKPGGGFSPVATSRPRRPQAGVPTHHPSAIHMTHTLQAPGYRFAVPCRAETFYWRSDSPPPFWRVAVYVLQIIKHHLGWAPCTASAHFSSRVSDRPDRRPAAHHDHGPVQAPGGVRRSQLHPHPEGRLLPSGALEGSVSGYEMLVSKLFFLQDFKIPHGFKILQHGPPPPPNTGHRKRTGHM